MATVIARPVLILRVSVILALLVLNFAQAAHRKKFLAANWKCNLETVAQVDALVRDLNHHVFKNDQVEVCVHPPYCFLDRVRRSLNSHMAVGSQNIYDATGPGAGYTGTCSPTMVASVGATWIMLGHSDRRNDLHESNAWIAQKARDVLSPSNSMRPMGLVLTVGETKWQRSTGRAWFTLREQLRVVVAALGIQLASDVNLWKRIVLAYEPVWAIGEGATPCSPEEAERVCGKLRHWIRDHVGAQAAEACRIAYTGSVNEKNVVQYCGLANIDGFVVGRAGLDSIKLQKILEAMTIE